MSKKPPTKPEYLNFVVYFDAVPSPGKMLAALLGAFGHISDVGHASISAQVHTDPRTRSTKDSLKLRTKLSSPEAARLLAAQPPSVNRVYVHIARRNSDDILRDFKLVIKFADAAGGPGEAPPEDNLGNPCDRYLLCPTLRISLRIDTLIPDSPDARARFADEVVRAVAGHATIRSGFVTCEPADRTNAGSLYMPPFGEELPMDLAIRELAWWRLMEPGRPLIRGVYWGNIWGAQIVERVNRINLLESISGWKVEHLTKGTMMPGGASVEHLADGSAFAKLSPDPLDSSETWREHGGKHFIGLFDSLANRQTSFAAWLHVQLRSLDLLL
jgi:hypothetical protein